MFAENDKYVLEIDQDKTAESPRTAWDNLGTMVCWHRRYLLGDDHNFTGPEEFRNEINERNSLILPVFLYDHTILNMSTSSFIGRRQHAEWDSGQVGWIYVLKSAIRQEWGVQRISPALRKHIYRLLESEVTVYSDYLCGNVYGFVLKEKTSCARGEGCHGQPDIKTVDSCWGFYGDDFFANGMAEYLPEDCRPLLQELIAC